MNARVAWGAAALGFALLFLAQLPGALAAAALFPLVGVVAGLGMAKWLPRALYGRQFRAGLIAGASGAVGAAAGLLLSALLAAPRTMAALAARSHLLGLRWSGQVYALRGVGWLGATLVVALLGGALCIVCSGLTTQIFAFDKSRRVIQAVDRAREAAQRSNRSLATARPTRRFMETPPVGMVLGRQTERPSAVTPAPVPNPWAETMAPPSGPLNLGAAQSRELHDALAAWAGPSGAPAAEHANDPPAAPEDPDAPPAERKPGNWLC
ncbi:MAG TPA: hypothetical protein VGR57_04000 [Ktedonobacterales bacterium]|nr:hypothetical protein [Ktedonobacterales bacterium]